MTNQTTDNSPNPLAPRELYNRLSAEIGRGLVGNETVLERLTIAVLTGGNVLIEGKPGVAKTTMAKLFGGAIGFSYSRIQMTPDMLPADITGTHVYREDTGEFELHRGPIFANLVLADEINRTTPKTQSALLEAMQERQVTIEGETLPLPDPFVLVATQNPIEVEGIFELPIAQRDRLQLKLTIDAPSRTAERELLERINENPDLADPSVSQVASTEDVLEARKAVWDVYLADEIIEYVLDIVEATETHPDVRYGASPRASIAFLNASKAAAALAGRDYVVPDDVKALAKSVLTHRLVLSPGADLGGVTPEDVVDEIVNATDPVGVNTDQLMGDGE
ncbi:MoxR family ATPase [Salinadaptatus halalkaliphilus]|uniref:MoxR family ATPase n=1 Tax=Salinadaptatus halalkaliphilus TaxID=2419781 RepID=A0A4S3TKA7_9EURY|nr:MoxR family ATPase [Salinadaptatus halalkaliphilus]THE64446.1 MoxR family ATPase [Salinadaptatus halalkaliphilus]